MDDDTPGMFATAREALAVVGIALVLSLPFWAALAGAFLWIRRGWAP